MRADEAWHLRPSLRQLAIFDAVSRAGSVGAAARELGLSQPAVTNALSKLEQRLETPLLIRGIAGTRGTAAGEILFRRVTRLRDQIVTAIAAVRREPLDSDGVRHRVAALTSTQLNGHLAVAGEGSFRAAARALAISEPALQRTARELERLIGVPLYAREGQSIRATRAGGVLATRLRLGLAEIAQAHDEIKVACGVGGGRIKLGCLPLMPKGFLAEAFGRLLARFPNVEISLEEGSYDQLIGALKQGQLDMLLGALRGPEAEDALESTTLFDDPYVVIARRGHPLANRARRPSAAALARHSWVAAPGGTPRRIALDRLFETLPERPRVVLETNSVAMMIATLSESDCLSLSSPAQTRIDFVGARLAQLRVPFVSTPRPIGVTLRVDWLPTEVQRNFLDLL